MAAGLPKTKDLIINVPPGTSKSSIVTILFPVWAWLQIPSLRFITSSYSASLSIFHSIKSRDVIRSDWFQKRFGHIFQMKADQDSKTVFENDKTGLRITTSVGGSVTGKHADILIADDPINVQDSVSQLALQDCNYWWDHTISTRLTDQKRSLKIIVMQRLNEKDLSGYCLENKKGQYELICMPGEETDAIYPKELKKHYVNGMLDPKRLDEQVMESLKLSLGTLGFTGQINQSPASIEGNLIKRDWFGRFTLNDLIAKVNGTPLYWNFTMDGAYTKDKLNDPSALLSYAIFENNIYIRDVISVWKEMPDLLNFLPEFCNRNGYNTGSRIYIEPKANGLSAAQMLRHTSNLNVVIDKSPTTDKIARVNACSPLIESRRVFLLQDAPWLEPFLHQCTMFPNARHDDEVDCLTMAVDKINDKNKITSFEIY